MRGVVPDVAPLRMSVSASSARGVGPARRGCRDAMCWSSVACVRSGDKRVRVGERWRRGGRNRADRMASITRRLK
eukprot:963872-Pleurochrysis_carterae.AAC.1